MTRPDPLIGTTAGDYTIDRRLGGGGFATVYAGRAADGRPVAIKVLLAEHLGSTAVMRFAREVAIVRRLRHPNIVDVLRAGVLPDGRPYCAMELLRGRDLGAVLGGRPLPAERVVEITSRVADALGAAHAAQIVHRDVKASNVFLCDDGRVVLLDFGIAKLAIVGGLTRSREAVGTIGSMAPEQLTGRPVDARTDIYALGALVHEMVTGGAPFRDPDTRLVIRLHRFAKRPRASLRGAPEALDAVIARAMAIRPDDRFATTAELADAVRAALGAGQRTRLRAIGVHVEALDAINELDALHAATAALRHHGFRPIVAGVAGGAWWRALDGIDERSEAAGGGVPPGIASGPFSAVVRSLVAGGVTVTVHVADLDLDSGHAAGGPLAELWRWVPDTAPAALLMTPQAVELLAS